MSRAGAIIVSGGSGSRMGKPKQFLPLGGSTVAEQSLACFAAMAEVEHIVLVLGEDALKEHGPRLAGGKVSVVAAGPTRMGSVRNGFAALKPGLDVVAVHDGARSLITPEIVRATFKKAAETGAAVAAVPVKDTLKRVAKGTETVAATPERAEHWAAQTPQTYRVAVHLEANVWARQWSISAVLETGVKVAVVSNITDHVNLERQREQLIEREQAARAGGAAALPRVGLGFDIHRLAEGRELWLAGVKLAHTKGLVGHSDGDAVLHAACDAVLGALGLGEIGIAFPPSDPKFKGLASKEIVAHTLGKVAAVGARIIHLDCTLIAEEPKLKPHYEPMKRSLAALFALPESRVSLKAKSHEGLGEIGRGEAIACHAVATVLTPEP